VKVCALPRARSSSIVCLFSCDLSRGRRTPQRKNTDAPLTRTKAPHTFRVHRLTAAVTGNPSRLAGCQMHGHLIAQSGDQKQKPRWECETRWNAGVLLRSRAGENRRRRTMSLLKRRILWNIQGHSRALNNHNIYALLLLFFKNIYLFGFYKLTRQDFKETIQTERRNKRVNNNKKTTKKIDKYNSKNHSK